MPSETRQPTIQEKPSPHGFSPDSLEYAIEQLHGLNCAVHRELLRTIAELHACETFTDDGMRSMEVWVSTKLYIPLPMAREWVRVAVALEHLPATAAAYGNGELSWPQVVELTRFATPEDENELIERTRAWTAAQIAALRRRLTLITRDEVAAEDRKRELFLAWNGNKLKISGEIYGSDGALVEKAINLVSERIYRETEGGPGDTYWGRAADALVEICNQDLDTDFDGDRSTLVVHVDANALATGEGTAEIENGPVLAIETLHRLGCDCNMEFVSEDPTGKAVGIGHKSRKIPPWLYRQLRYRDKGCRFGGCGGKRGVNAHHIVHWAAPHNGPTEAGNLVLLCRRHHKTVHEEGWQILGDPNEDITFVAPDGTRLRAGPPPLEARFKQRLLPIDAYLSN